MRPGGVRFGHRCAAAARPGGPAQAAAERPKEVLEQVPELHCDPRFAEIVQCNTAMARELRKPGAGALEAVRPRR